VSWLGTYDGVQWDGAIQSDKTSLMFHSHRKQVGIRDLLGPMHEFWVDQSAVQMADIVWPEAVIR
jgi:hypothetical protein